MNLTYRKFAVVSILLISSSVVDAVGARARVALTGLTVAEYFRDKEGQDVLLFIDNIFRFTQAGSEVGTCIVLVCEQITVYVLCCGDDVLFPCFT